jgi:sugar lactone lactonase YvrE
VRRPCSSPTARAGSFASTRGPARAASSPAGSGHVTDVALGPGGAIYAVAAGRVVKLGAHGRPAVVARIANAFGLAVARSGTLFVTDDVGGRLLAIRGGRTRVVARGFDQPGGVAVGSDGSIYVASGHNGDGRVDRVAADGRRTWIASLGLPTFIAPLSGGALLVVDHVGHESNGAVVRIERDGTVTELSAGRIRAPVSAARLPSGEIYVTSFGDLRLGRLDVATGDLVPLG